MTHCSPFGPMLREERLKRGIPLWKFAASVPFPVANIHRIEAGRTEPRIGIAMKMLAVIDADIGSFMQTLAEAQDWNRPTIPDGFSIELLAAKVEKLRAEGSPLEVCPKALFGIYFRSARAVCGLTQATVAARTDYTTRSLIAVESGKQEPKIMRAVQLVWVMGVPVSDFFSLLARRIE